MQREYRVELGDLWRGTLSLRRLRVLLDHLPFNSGTAHTVAGLDGALAGWSLNDILLARLVDELSAYRWQWESAHTKNGKSSRKPPSSVLPDARARRVQRDEQRSADVIPLVSPHSLGRFIDEEPQEGT